jgi:hypothetical protein
VLTRRALLGVLLPFALHGLAREVDAAVGLLLHTSLDLPDFAARALGLLDPRAALQGALSWAAGGVLLWLLLGLLRSRIERTGLREALDAEADFAPLLLRPALTVLALFSLQLQPTFPYAFTLPVGLTQDLGLAQDAAVLAVLLAARAGLVRFRLPAVDAASLWLIAFLAYALGSPAWSRTTDGHPGNEPKTLRMALAVGHGLTLDVSDAYGSMEDLPVRPLSETVPAALSRIGSESVAMAQAILTGHAGRNAITATRITRQTIRGKDRGIYHVLAPGPSFLLAGPLRLDRAVNLRFGLRDRPVLTLLFWNALAAALVVALFLLLRDATGRPGPSALLAAGFGVLPPYFFYAYQFYPEMLGALWLTVLLRELLYVPRLGRWRWLGVAVLLAFLPWLHQKFLPLWAVLLAMALWRLVEDLEDVRALLILLLPQAVSAWLFLLLNFAATGSARPDALFLAWGPAGVSGERIGQGLLGLLLDARFGLLPYVPLYLLALPGLWLARGRAARLRWALPAALVYYATVASADNWSGAVCNLGRYAMPVTPLLLAFVAVAVGELRGRRGALALLSVLAAWSGLLAAALVLDPHAANDCWLLLLKSTFADFNLYLPNLFLRTWAEAAPGLAVRVLAFVGLGLLLAALWCGSALQRPNRVLFGLIAVLLLVGLGLERWPTVRRAPLWPDIVPLEPGLAAFLPGAGRQADLLVLEGDGELLVRSREPQPRLRAIAFGTGFLRVGSGRVALTKDGAWLDLPLEPVVTLEGRRGVSEHLLRQRLASDAPVLLRIQAAP